MTAEAFRVLGIEPTAGEDEIRAARRRLAKDLHPDRAGGDAERMQQLNVAFETALAVVHAPPAAAPDPAPVADPAPRRSGAMQAHDVASFTIEALPAEAFEAVLIAATWIGEPMDDDPPYRLDVDLAEPFDCWCRVELVPDAGSSTVSLTLASRDGRPVPDIDRVRDTWVMALNTLGRPDP
jgi:hypothetical protein